MSWNSFWNLGRQRWLPFWYPIHSWRRLLGPSLVFANEWDWEGRLYLLLPQLHIWITWEKCTKLWTPRPPFRPSCQNSYKWDPGVCIVKLPRWFLCSQDWEPLLVISTLPLPLRPGFQTVGIWAPWIQGPDIPLLLYLLQHQEQLGIDAVLKNYFIYFRNIHWIYCVPRCGEFILSLIIYSYGCTETSSVFGERRNANIEVKIVTNELNRNSRSFAAVTYHVCTYWGVSEERAVVGVIPGGFTYKSGLVDLEEWVVGREKRWPGDMTFPDRWRCPHLSLHAELCGAKSSTSRTCWHLGVSQFYFLMENPDWSIGKKTVPSVKKPNKDEQVSTSVSVKWRAETKRILIPSFHLNIIFHVLVPRDTDSIFKIKLPKV